MRPETTAGIPPVPRSDWSGRRLGDLNPGGAVNTNRISSPFRRPEAVIRRGSATQGHLRGARPRHGRVHDGRLHRSRRRARRRGNGSARGVHPAPQPASGHGVKQQTRRGLLSGQASPLAKIAVLASGNQRIDSMARRGCRPRLELRRVIKLRLLGNGSRSRCRGLTALDLPRNDPTDPIAYRDPICTGETLHCGDHLWSEAHRCHRCLHRPPPTLSWASNSQVFGILVERVVLCVTHDVTLCPADTACQATQELGTSRLAWLSLVSCSLD